MSMKERMDHFIMKQKSWTAVVQCGVFPLKTCRNSGCLVLFVSPTQCSHTSTNMSAKALHNYMWEFPNAGLKYNNHGGFCRFLTQGLTTYSSA